MGFWCVPLHGNRGPSLCVHYSYLLPFPRPGWVEGLSRDFPKSRHPYADGLGLFLVKGLSSSARPPTTVLCKRHLKAEACANGWG